MDLRTRKVYNALIEAMKTLMTEKRFEEITVGELCEKAQTRRATFYSHFSDKYEFFAFMLKEMRKELFEEAGDKLATNDPIEYAHVMIDIGLSFIEKNRDFLLRFENNAAANGLLMIVTDRLNQDNKERLAVLPAQLQDEITAQFLIGALNQCVRWWMCHMDKVPREEMKKKMYALADSVLKTAAE